jgi:hypothetical protein
VNKPLHAKEEKPSDFEPPKPVRPRRWPWIVLAVFVVLTAAITYFKFLCPQARVKRAFMHSVAALEKKDSEKILEFISDDYYDDMGNTKTIIGTASAFLFKNYDKIDVKITRMEIKFDTDSKALVTVEGKVYLKVRNELYRIKPDKPATFILIRGSDSRWRVSTVENMDISLDSIEKEVF